MNELTSYLEKLIEEVGSNKYQIAKKSGLDKTTLQRLLKGQRLPGTAFIEKLCDYLCVTSVQRANVREFYQIQKVGKGAYNNRLYIKTMLERLSNLSSSSSAISINVHPYHMKKNEIKIYDNRYQIQSTLKNIIEDELWNNEQPIIRLNVPFNYEYLFDILKYNCDSLQKTYSIEHIIKLNKNSKELSNNNYNLENLSKVLPLAFHKQGKYMPFYYYGSVEYALEQETLMPYFILTSRYLIQLSYDYSKLVVNNNKDYYELYLNHFEKHISSCRMLITPLENAANLLSMHTENIGYVRRTDSLQPQPCFGVYYTTELIEKKIKSDFPNRDLFVKAADQFFTLVRQSKSKLRNYFTTSGLEAFIETGSLVDIPDECIDQITVEERLHFLRSLYDDIKEDIYYSRAIDSSRFNMSPHSSIAFYETSEFILFNEDGKGSITACYIDEPEISSAFEDFVLSLKESDYIFSKEDTLSILESKINELASS